MIRATLLAGSALLLCGCYTTTVRSGAPPGEIPRHLDEKWHDGFLLGAVESSGPYEVARDGCPRGWSELRVETSFLNGLVTVLTLLIYTPQTVTLTCAAEPDRRGGPPPLPPPAHAPAVVPEDEESTPASPEDLPAPPEADY